MSDVQLEKVSQENVIKESALGITDNGERVDVPASSNGSGNAKITEHEENHLLAEDDDLDVIDCYTDDFDSDMENEFCRKQKEKEKNIEPENPRTDNTCEEEKATDKICDEKQLENTSEQVDSREKCLVNSLQGLENDDEDMDVIQIDDDSSDIFIELPNNLIEQNGTMMSLSVENEKDKNRILSEPLVKQIVPKIVVTDEDDNSMVSQESLSLKIDHWMEKATGILDETQGKPTCNGMSDSHDAMEGQVLNNSGDTSDTGNHRCHQEDPEVLRLKVDLYQEMGGMDYEQDDKTDEDGEKNSCVRVKQEPISPTKKRVNYPQTDDIPTIVLSSTDEESNVASPIKSEEHKSKIKRYKHRKNYSKISTESLVQKISPSLDSFDNVTESAESRFRDYLVESGDAFAERVKSLRNRNVTILPEIFTTIGPKKSKPYTKCVDNEARETIKKKKKIDPVMQGYKRRKSICRASSKSSSISASTGVPSIPDDDLIVLAANGILISDSYKGQESKQNIEKDFVQQEEMDVTAGKEELKSEVLEKTFANELVDDVLLKDNDNKIEDARSSSFPVPTTDIAFEDMLDAWIEKEPHGKDRDGIFHSISSEEKFLMDSLFADCEKQSQQLPSQEHLETLNTIMDDGKPLVDQFNEVPISVSYTVSNEKIHHNFVHVQADASKSASFPSKPKSCKIKTPQIKIIQNYQKYPFEAKASKKQQKLIEKVAGKASFNTKVCGKRGRKRLSLVLESDEEYNPKRIQGRKRISNHSKKSKINAMLSKKETVLTEKHLTTTDANDEKQMKIPENNKSDDDTTSSVCIHMPSLEADLALTSSDESLPSMVDNMHERGSKQLPERPLKKTSVPAHENFKENCPQMTAKRIGSGINLVLSAVRKRGRPKLIKSGLSTNQYSTKQLKHSSELTKETYSTNGHKIVGKSKIIQTYGRTECKEKDVRNFKLQKSSPSLQSLKNDKKIKNRKRKSFNISCSEERETSSASNNIIRETEHPSASSVPLGADKVKPSVETTNGPGNIQKPSSNKMDNLQIVISPLTEKKIRMLNAPRKRLNTASKACQTEIYGMTWSIHWDQINFRSEYFNNFRNLLNEGANHTKNNQENHNTSRDNTLETRRSFNDIAIPNRSALDCILDSQSSPLPTNSVANKSYRTYADELLFHRHVGEFENVKLSNSDGQRNHPNMDQVLNNVKSSFRIPKLTKKLSMSPQVVTSSTSHGPDFNGRDNENSASLPQSTSRVNSQLTLDGASVNAASGSGAYGLVTNDFNGDSVQHTKDRNNNTHQIGPEPFSLPLIRNMNSDPHLLTLQRVASEPQIDAQAVSNPLGSAATAEKRSNLPSRSELLNVKRTIRNDNVQPQSLPTLHCMEKPTSQSYLFEMPKFNVTQQPALPSFPMQGSTLSQPFAVGNINTFDRGTLPNYSAMNLTSVFGGGMLGMQQPENCIQTLMAMWMEQMRQQQILKSSSSIPSQNIPNQMSGSGAMFPPMTMPSSLSQYEPQHSSDKDVISFTFGCVDFLTNKCNHHQCRYPHVVPKEEEVFQKLSMQNRDSIMTTYKFVASVDELFNKYFPVFATVMGRNNMRHQLVSTIPDCEQPKRPIQYYKYIVEGLKMSGTSPVQAVQIILEKHTKRNFHQINVLIDLILDTGHGILTFLRTLEEFSNVKDFQFDIVSINRLLLFCNNAESPSIELAVFLSKLILNVPAGEEHLVCARALIEFTGKARVYPELSMNVEYIIRKYGKIEMTT